jgi:hypothetical protein
MSAISLFRAGHCIVPPENPPSSYSVGTTVQPSCFCDAMKAVQAFCGDRDRHNARR